MKVIGVHMDRCTGCKTCELYCAAERGSEGKTLLKAVQETPAPQPRVRVEGGGRAPSLSSAVTVSRRPVSTPASPARSAGRKKAGW